MKSLTDNLAWKLLALLVAFCLWIFVLSSHSVSVEVTRAIDLRLPPGLVVANKIPDKIAFRLSGSKFFLRSVVNSGGKIKVDLSKAKAGPSFFTVLSDSLRLPIGIKVLSISPSSIRPVLEEVKIKNVSVRLQSENKVPTNYRLIQFKASPAIVRIRGPKSKVSRIREIRPPAVDLSDIRPSLRWEIPISTGIPGVEFDEEVDPVILMEVEPKGSNFRIAGVDLKILADSRYQLDVEKVALYVNTSKKRIKSLTPDKVQAVIDLRGKKRGSYVREVKVTLPRGVNLVKVVPSNVKIRLE